MPIFLFWYLLSCQIKFSRFEFSLKICYSYSSNLQLTMDQEMYSFNWETYSDHLRSMMKDMMMNDEFSDVTLVSEDNNHVKAHKNVLSACSSAFREIFKKDKSSKPIIYLRGIQFSEIESIIQFIYLGKATFLEERMDEFLAVAKSLGIKELCYNETETEYEPKDKSFPSTSEDSDIERTSANFEEQSVQSNHIINQAPREIRSEREEVDGAIQPMDKPFPSTPEHSDKVISSENMEEKSVQSYHIINQAPQETTFESNEGVGVNERYECEKCHNSFKNKKYMRRHIQSAHEGFTYDCDQCGYQAARKTHLKEHIESRHEGVKYACDYCEYQASLKSYLKRHSQSQHEGLKYTCDQCDYQAPQKIFLNEHIQAIHESAKYSCDQCDYQTAAEVSLTNHIQAKHVKHACDQCDYTASQKGNLRWHIQSRHEGVKEVCNQCDYQTSQKGQLKVHIQSKHEGVTFSCDQCDYQTGMKTTLRLHIRSKHENVRYSCDKCDFKATRSDGLRCHIQSNHEGVRHSCDQCGKQFTAKTHLRVHIRSMHEGIKYACDQCEYQATQKGNLNLHIQKMH